jgi:hypothetical protein
MYEELASDGSTRLVGTLEDIQNQYKLKQRSRDTSNSKVDDGFISDMWSVMDRAGNLLISKHHDYGSIKYSKISWWSDQRIKSSYVGQDSPHQPPCR